MSKQTEIHKQNLTYLCRICLNDGATCPIFEEVEKLNSVYSRFRECFNEKIKDVEGYPRSICLPCKETLENVLEFLNKYKKSCKILENGLLSLKQEHIKIEASSDLETDDVIDIKFEKPIKPEPEVNLETLDSADHFIDLLKPLEDVTRNEVKRESFKAEKNVAIKLHKKYKYKSKTDKVATSILEGEFAWTGEQWCLKSTVLKMPKTELKRQRDTRLKIPHKKTIKQSKLCDVCGDTFKNQHKLTLHRNKIHLSKPMQCPQCSRVCYSEHNLHRHIKRKHSEKEFSCTTCGGKFAFKSELRNHINKVHNKKPKPLLTCQYCDKKYVTQKSIIIHERSAHTGERPAKCDVCFKAFFHEDYLKEHMRLHTGEAPFKCPVCDRGYAQRGNMKSHLRIHRISELDSVTLSKMRPNYLKLLKNY